jgi:hypothetical protein
MQTQVLNVRDNMGLTRKEADDINFNNKSKKNRRGFREELGRYAIMYVKRTLEKDVINYLKTATEKYKKLSERYEEKDSETGKSRDAEGAKALLQLNTNVNTVLSREFGMTRTRAGMKNSGTEKIKGTLPTSESAIADAILGV